MKKEKGYVYFLGKICYDKYDNAEKQEGKEMKDSRILKEELLQGNYEELFREIYQDDSEAKRQNARYAQAVEKFEELFGEKQVEIYSAPGRSEVGGNHTDHQHGMVLATSINLDAVAVVSPVDSL